MKIQHLTKKELEIMEILWKEQKPLTSSEIVELSQNSSWKDSSIHILLNALLKKELIKVDNFKQKGKTYARTFLPAISFEEYTVSQIQQNKSFTFNSVPKIVATLLNNDKISKEENKELLKTLQHVINEKAKNKLE
ncbi:BlaI/MecI/CopY family transcriptional regulator [Clostridium sp.]|jgi:predicted transcriptional regulator|uniref:BlaI/MecI/CopY family transcriptional regulator n=1 Tax=Clostridium sp. TaxID=1506 RepID=UPI0025799715|nr:BlaI/MecI/CopY family transcriptional regulator [Clostridium sp.]MBE6057481.1 BlaI/MecI/CopY family transcriptional regulator [Clostridium sp.]